MNELLEQGAKIIAAIYGHDWPGPGSLDAAAQQWTADFEKSKASGGVADDPPNT